jgi:hypothetical protein
VNEYLTEESFKQQRFACEDENVLVTVMFNGSGWELVNFECRKFESICFGFLRFNGSVV